MGWQWVIQLLWHHRAARSSHLMSTWSIDWDYRVQQFHCKTTHNLEMAWNANGLPWLKSTHPCGIFKKKFFHKAFEFQVDLLCNSICAPLYIAGGVSISCRSAQWANKILIQFLWFLVLLHNQHYPLLHRFYAIEYDSADWAA